MMAAAPVSGGGFQGVWTGSELIVHRPDYQKAKGSISAAYNPVTNKWRRLAAGSYTVVSSEAGTQVAWTGSEMLTFGVMNAAYNPVTNKWRALKSPPQAAPSVVVWTGEMVLYWGGGCCDEALADGSAYDPVANSWTALPAAPLSGRHAAGAWTGTELIVVGGQAHRETYFADAAAYNPATKSWRTLPSLPSPRSDASVTWTGTELLVVGGTSGIGAVPYADGYAYNPATNQWRHMASMGLARLRHMAVWTGDYLLVWGGQTRTGRDAPMKTPPSGMAYDPRSDRWVALPTAPIKGRTGAIAAWTGTSLVIWGGTGAVEPFASLTDGGVYDLADSQ